MNIEARNVIIGVSGLLAGGLTAALAPWSPPLKTAMVVAVSVVVSTLAWAMLRPRPTQ
jgi:membrane protein implicated in regulation of membrane protease activity